MEILGRAEQLKAELDSLRPLDAEAEARIMQKFRLDWNYHSNNLEGNSLTYGETKALILFGITAQGKPLKDHFEITGHNDAINWVLDLVKGETELTEVFIRKLHTLLLKESSYKEAQTPDGKPTRRKIEVGKYKTQPNHVLTVTGETFYFATPEETPAKMQELVEWFRNEKTKPEVNPIILSALFHYKFIRIHPFDDGNGRVARILMNFILMQFGYPPVIIKTEDKENYYAVLRLADADQIEPFIEYIATNLVRSLEIMIRGAKGEEIDEPEDLDKELSLLEAALKHDNSENRRPKTNEIVDEILHQVVYPLVDRFGVVCRKFDRFYVNKEVFLELAPVGFVLPADSNLLPALKEHISNADRTNFAGFELSYKHSEFRNPNYTSFDFRSMLIVDFKELVYVLQLYGVRWQGDTTFEKSYSDIISDADLVEALSKLAQHHKLYLEGKTKDET